jgi:hypothetical protein
VTGATIFDFKESHLTGRQPGDPATAFFRRGYESSGWDYTESIGGCVRSLVESET